MNDLRGNSRQAMLRDIQYKPFFLEHFNKGPKWIGIQLGFPARDVRRKMDRLKIPRNSKNRASGPANGMWNGGVKKCGKYRMLLSKDHPFAGKNGYVLEHRLVMEKYLGRYLTPEEVVHHKNDIPSDNRISNLRLFACQADHAQHHKNIITQSKLA